MLIVLGCTYWQFSAYGDSSTWYGDGRRQKYIDYPKKYGIKMPSGHSHHDKYIVNDRGQLIYSQEFYPEGEPIGVICFMHGYADSSNWACWNYYERFVSEGYICLTLDYPGHGKSDGLWVYIPRIQDIVDDVIKVFKMKKAAIGSKYPNIKWFGFGESLGGAVALYVARQAPDIFSGEILAAPMVKIADDIKPPKATIATLIALSKLIPTVRYTPVKNVLLRCYKMSETLERAYAYPLHFPFKPRFGTSRELLRVSNEMEATLEENVIPLLILHGSADLVTDPSVSKALYDRASSTDKTLKLYEGYWHSIINGEPHQNRQIVWKDILDWLELRVSKKE